MTDDLEARLRAAVHAEAGATQHDSDSLTAIRARVRSARRRRHSLALLGAVALVVVLAAVPRMSNNHQKVTTAGGSTTTVATNPSLAPSTTTNSTTTTEAPTTATEPSAAEILEPFLTAATALDGQLREAATAINGAGPPWIGVSQQVAGTVHAAALEPVAQTIPAGLPPDLLRSVILVYSDLASRRFAMQGFSQAHDAYPEEDLGAELGNGHPAAARFDEDLAALRSQSASTPSVTVPAADSRQAAEVLLIAQYVNGLNAGCGSRGGAIVTELPLIEWVSADHPDAGYQTDGTINGVEFTADLNADSTWAIEVIAC